MTRIKCPAVECVHNRDGRCSAKEISLNQRRIGTMWEGRKTVWECKSYEWSEQYKEIVQMLGGNVRGSDQEIRMDGDNHASD